MLANVMHNVYIDKEWIANEYIRHCKEGVWKDVITNVGRIIDTELLGRQIPTELTLEDLLSEATSYSNVGNGDGDGDCDAVVAD